MSKIQNSLPIKQGLYDPSFEHDACGVGFVCNIAGERSNQIIQHGLEVLVRLSHRGAVGADPETGDGAGILIQIPHEFFSKVCSFELPPAGQYGVGMVFLPQNQAEKEYCKERFAKAAKDEGQNILGWRETPTDSLAIGQTARQTQPFIEQVFVACSDERKLYSIRRRVEELVSKSKIEQKAFFYVTGLSARTVAYKGLLMPHQVSKFFIDLQNPELRSALALVHSRYSTNTFPTWDLAQPFRFLAHNGEINTLRGNINWMKARGIDVIVEGGSDSAALDNVLELLVLSGRSLPHAIMMLIPPAWEHNQLMDAKLRDFYKYHACFMEPWDGPAAVAFTDGTRIGAILDRNGLRPARYIVTKDNFAVMASEVGVFDIPAEKIAHSGRLEPGKMLYIDTEQKRIVHDGEIKEQIASQKPYSKWIGENLEEYIGSPSTMLGVATVNSLNVFGYTREDLKFILAPMAENGAEPIGSMGNDTPLAVLSNKPQLLYNYFKQLFAQVTNPPIDPIREELVMSLESFLCAKQNILEETPAHCRAWHIKSPVISTIDLNKITSSKKFKAKTIDVLFEANDPKGLVKAIDRVCQETEKAVLGGNDFIVLSDRNFNQEKAALPALLITGAVHHYLINKALRTKVSILIDSGEPREVHHFALLFGYGADLVCPYMAFAAIEYLIQENLLKTDLNQAAANYVSAVEHGILKILSKMGISTLRSYRGAQIFEALGLNDEVVNKCFAGTPSRIGGNGFSGIAAAVLARHQKAFESSDNFASLETGGVYQWKRDGEFHLWNPDSIAALQDAVRKGDYNRYKEFAGLINDQSQHYTTLRSLLRFAEGGDAHPRLQMKDVEPVSSIVKRFVSGAMSFGSISAGAHETIARAMNQLGGKSNTGEGGEDPARFADDRRSATKQVASGRFGVTANYLINADEIQIKIAQGAKPGEGGQLPGHKVSAIIARTRYTTPGVTLISPPPHHDIYSIEDLAQLIFDLKNINPRARISVKLVSEIGVGTVAVGVAKGHADMILISGGDGGTGASPRSSIRHAGLPWELGLSETNQTLALNNLRDRVRLQTDGQMRTGRDVAIAAMLGADEYGFCTSLLITIGCVMLRHCHLNNCAVGVATQDELLSGRFTGKPEYIVNYLSFVAEELREIMASLSIRTVAELVGRSDLLAAKDYRGVDFRKILYRPRAAMTRRVDGPKNSDELVKNVLDHKLIELAKPALIENSPVTEKLAIKNSDRAVGAMLSGEVCKKYGEQGMAGNTIHFSFKGEAGQSFGAFLAKGITFELEGLSNDYIGKGLSGGKIVVYPYKSANYISEDNILIGNTTFYGAIAGEAYIAGIAGERFCIRNSGVYAVVEGVGDHGCEYMTGGRVVVIGETGRNFAAGMSGGIAYVLNENGKFNDRCNLEMVELEKLNQEDESLVRELLVNHHRATNSAKAGVMIDNFTKEIKKFVKVMPKEYKRIIALNNENALNEVSDG